MDNAPLLALENVTFAYTERPVLFQNIHFILREGEQIGLHGPGGSGKTTLLRLLMGLETPSSGQVLYRERPVNDKHSLRELRNNTGFVMQHSDDQLFSVTVLEDVAFGPLNLGLNRKDARERAMEALADLGLSHLGERTTQRLSGGEKKMVALASVLSMRPRVLLLDEPTAFLDDEATTRIRAILLRQQLPRIVVSHDLGFLRQIATSLVAVQGDGRMESFPTKTLE